MTVQSRKNQRRVIASVLTGMLILQQTTLVGAFASNISGFSQTSGTFNINPERASGTMGFRNYENFNLSEGDIANLIYKYGSNNIETFVNLVDNKININGIVNSTRDGNFYNGKAIFVSPNGMVVGASGVLNVGSLGVYTPSTAKFNSEKNGTPDFESMTKNGDVINGYGSITVNGKVLAVKDVALYGHTVDVSSTGGIATGINSAVMGTTKANADLLFDSIVSGNYKSATGFTNNNGSIHIETNQQQTNVDGRGINITGKVRNVAQNGGITLSNRSRSGGITISGDVINDKGSMVIKNYQNDIRITGNVENNGSTEIKNLPGGVAYRETDASGNLTGGYDYGSVNSGLYISGNVNTSGGTLDIVNGGLKGMELSGNINHTGALNIQNGLQGTSPDVIERNAGMGALKISGNVTNTSGNTNITNYAKGGINVTAGENRVVNSHGNLTMLNTGADGMTINGNISNTGKATVTNQAGAMTIGGTFANTGDAIFTNEEDATNLTVSKTGKIKVTNGKLTMTNDGSEGFYVNGDGTGKANITSTGGIDMTNNGAGGLHINGAITSNSTSTYVNNADAFEVGQYANIQNTEGTATFTNNGTGDMTFAGTVNNSGTTYVTNSANSGKLLVGGSFTNNGTTTMTNNGTTFDVTGTVTNNTGKLTMTNNKGALTVDTGATINAQGLEMENNGDGGFNIKGAITNTKAGTFTNNKGAFVAAAGSNIQNTSNTATFTNGANATDMTFAGTVNNSGTTVITNNGTGKLTVGGSFTNNGETTMTNKGTGFDLIGTVNNTGTTVITNNGSGKLTVGGSFTNNGETTMTNNGAGFDVTGTVTNKTNKLTMRNNKGALTVDTGATINAQGLVMENNGDGGFNVKGAITNAGAGTYTNNKGAFNAYEGSSIKNTSNTATFTNGTNATGMTFAGTVDNTGTTNVTNNGTGKLTVGGNFTNNGATTMTNNGAGFDVTGTVTNKGGKLTLNNTKGALDVTSTGKIDAQNNLDMTNSGAGGLLINGEVTNSGVANITNNAGDLAVKGKVTNTKNRLTMHNKGKGLYIYRGATVTNNSETLIENNGNDGLNIEGTVTSNTTFIVNTNNKVDISGKVHSDNNTTITNSGNNGILIQSSGRVDADNDLIIENNIATNRRTDGAVKVQGLLKAKNNVSITSTNGDVVIGDGTTNDNYISAGKNINLTVNDGSILNSGVEKVLLKADNDLNMHVTNGTIGLGVQQKACEGSGCTGIGPKADGSRDFTKSINAKIGGNVTATTTNTTDNAQDLVINYAAIDSDMKIDHIKADGRVILTVDDDYGKNNTGKRYNMINASTDPTKANVEGWGMSLISNGSIGSKENKITFNQTKAPEYAMDALANENIYMKALDDKYTKNEVCTMIAREGDLDVEFAGNTHIKNITAEGDMTVITRGKTLEIDNIGHIVDNSVTPADYFGPRHDGYEFDGRNNGEYKADTLPNNVKVKALDINKNIRPDGVDVDGGYYGMADSTVIVHNAVIDNGKMEITADNIYANGIYAGFNQHGFSKKEDNRTNKVIGVVDPDSFNIPVGKAVRPGDVTGIDRDKYERNYYYPTGDGDITIGNKTTTVDDNDNIADGTPLAFGDATKPEIKPDDPTPKRTDDGKSTWKKRGDDNVEAIDKRQFMRFNIDGNTCPVAMEKMDNGIDQLLDVSRGGIAVSHSNKLNVGDVIPVHLTYADLDIKADVKVVTATTTRAGATFVNIDKATANKLLYLSLMLEDNKMMSFNR